MRMKRRKSTDAIHIPVNLLKRKDKNYSFVAKHFYKEFIRHIPVTAVVVSTTACLILECSDKSSTLDFRN
jgi:hypothetical protein